MRQTGGERTMPQNLIYIVAGPTASGKSALALDLALRKNGVVINADSMQIYKGLPVITACPDAQDKKKVPHKLYEILDPAQRGNVVDWLEKAKSEIEMAWAQNRTPIVTGGTGYYLDNLINGTTPVPATAPKIRAKVAEILEEKGIEEIYQALQEVDPESATRLNAHDTTRVCRAYEVWLDTNIKLSEWHKRPMEKAFDKATFKVIKLCPNAQELNPRCDKRFDLMIQGGALEEVSALRARRLDPALPAMNALGVPELMAYLEGKSSLEEAVTLAKLHTRQYAKRQRTWFKNKLKADLEISLFDQKSFKSIDI